MTLTHPFGKFQGSFSVGNFSAFRGHLDLDKIVPGVLAEVRGTVGCVSASLDTSGGLGRLLVQVHAGEVEGVCAVLGRKFSMVGVLDPVDGTV